MKILILLSLFVCQSSMAGALFEFKKAPQSVSAPSAQSVKNSELKSALAGFPDGLQSQVASCASVEVEQGQDASQALYNNVDEITEENNMGRIYLLQYCIGKVFSEN